MERRREDRGRGGRRGYRGGEWAGGESRESKGEKRGQEQRWLRKNGGGKEKK